MDIQPIVIFYWIQLVCNWEKQLAFVVMGAYRNKQHIQLFWVGQYRLYLTIFQDKYFRTRIPTHQYHLSAEHREISIFHEWVMHLSELFKVSLKDIMLEFQHFDQQTTDLITELFIFQNNNSRLNTCFLEHNKLLGRMEENLITSILNRQNAQKTLKLDFEFSPQFGFNIINLKNHPKYLIITHSHWVDINIVFEMRCSFIRLQKSNFSKDQCKMLIEKWKEGWTPKWSTLQIQYSENLDVDYCVNEPNAEIKPAEQHDKGSE